MQIAKPHFIEYLIMLSQSDDFITLDHPIIDDIIFEKNEKIDAKNNETFLKFF